MRNLEDSMEIKCNIPWFRELYDLLMDYEGDNLYEAVLQPWTAKAQTAVSAFAQFQTMSRYDTKSDEFVLPIWNLYALSRVNDYLLLPFQNDEREGWAGPAVSVEQYLEFFIDLGFTPIVSTRFSAFRHEIVRVQPSQDEAAPISVVEVLWPGLMFGNMLVSRSGIVASGGASNLVTGVADGSTLYFTHRRLHRKTSDLSMGWGSNSQWRTTFRRDYECQGKRIYNIDGEHSLNRVPSSSEDRDNLTIDERIELCRNRCFLVTKKSHGDLWPFDDQYEEHIS
jgi:hypothetical protein